MRRRLAYTDEGFVDLETGEKVEGDFDTVNRDVYLDLDTVLHFGKFRGRTLKDVIYADEEKGWAYFYWLYDKGFNVSKAAVKESNLHTRSRYEKKHPHLSREYRSQESIELMNEITLGQIKRHLDQKAFEKYGIGEDDYELGFDFNVNDLF